MHPPSADHRRDDADLRELVGKRVAVEDDEIGELPWNQPPAATLVAGEPGGRDGRSDERVLDGNGLLGVPGLAVVERRSYVERPPRVEYKLTSKGEGLLPVIEAMRRFGHDWLVPEHGHAHDEPEAVSA